MKMDFENVSSHFHGVGDRQDHSNQLIDWRSSQRLLLMMLNELMGTGYLAYESNLINLINTHFTWRGRSFKPSSLKTEYYAVKQGTIDTKGWAELQSMLKKLPTIA